MQVGAGYFLRILQAPAWWGVLIPYGLFVLWVLGLRLNSVLSFGGDDGFELCKAALVARRPDLAPLMWNDQPWLHTLLNATLFRLVGEHAALPRILSLISLGALLAAMVFLLRRTLSFAGGLALGCFLITADGMPNLSVAAMLELPAISWAMVASALAATPPGVVIRRRLLSAGALLALACHVKFTSLLVLPALLVMVWMQTGRRLFASALVWAALSFVTTFSLLVQLSPSFDLEQLLSPHFKTASVLIAAERAQFHLQWEWVLGDPAPLMAALFAMAHPFFKRGCPFGWFTLVLLGTAVGIALCYRPWWRYYLIHIQVPTAMLGGVGVTWLSQQLSTLWGKASTANNSPVQRQPTTPLPHHAVPGVIMGTAAVVALWCGFALPRMISAMEEMSNYPTTQSNPLVSVLRRYQDRIQWCYTDSRDVAFHGGVLIPPELIVLSRKRFWHGDLDERRLWNWVRLYTPEAIVVSEHYRVSYPTWTSWLNNEYVLCAKEHGQECWVARSLNPDAIKQSEDRLKYFGF